MGAVTLEEIRQDADQTYPADMLAGCTDALLLFAAGFLGRQDGIWVADAGLTAVCVDWRRPLLHEMAAIYPADWQFVQGDVYELAANDELPDADLVSVDCPSGHFQACADLLAKWCAVANRAVILGTNDSIEIVPPNGWRLLERRRRSDFAGGTYWAIIVREAPL